MFNQSNIVISLSEVRCQSGVDLMEFGKRFPVGRVLYVRRANARSFSAMMVDYDRDFPISGNWYSEDVHFFDMSLSKRPPGARGYFGESFNDYRTLGKYSSCLQPLLSWRRWQRTAAKPFPIPALSAN
jgi:hypothetical protein